MNSICPAAKKKLALALRDATLTNVKLLGYLGSVSGWAEPPTGKASLAKDPKGLGDRLA